MQRYVEGDVQAFRRLFDTLAPAIHGFFVRSAGDRVVADDLTQTTFLRIHRARRQWRAGERLRPWVFSIAAHVRADWLRRHGRIDSDPFDEELLAGSGEESDPGVDFEVRERGELLRAALDSLTEAQRVVVHLHRYEGLGFADIGRVLGISEGAAKLRAFRAYEALRKRLSELAEDGR